LAYGAGSGEGAIEEGDGCSVTLAQDLDDLFSQGALVQFHESTSLADPPTHAVAGLWPISDNEAICWDTGIGMEYSFTISKIETMQTAPCLLVKAITADGYVLISDNLGPIARAHAAALRLVQQQSARDRRAEAVA
jgi:hypothetical protein